MRLKLDSWDGGMKLFSILIGSCLITFVAFNSAAQTVEGARPLQTAPVKLNTAPIAVWLNGEDVVKEWWQAGERVNIKFTLHAAIYKLEKNDPAFSEMLEKVRRSRESQTSIHFKADPVSMFIRQIAD